MSELLSRLGLYGTGAAVVVGLAIAMGSIEADADINTLLSSADVQLRMAYAIPEVDKAGIPLDSRQTMILAAEEHLKTVERLQPGMACTAEFRGFARMLQGDYQGAAAFYASARQARDCSADQFDVVTFNQARMLAKAGRGEEALQVFANHAAALDARFGQQRLIEEAQILVQLGRPDHARQQLAALLARNDLEPMAGLQAAQILEQVGSLADAERAYAQQQQDIPAAGFGLARLKLRAGEVDTALALLERAVAAAPAEVARLVQQDVATWVPVQTDPRFQRIVEGRSATPGR
jgi:tetratricopeptide (TPR) repeat protein